MRKKQFKAESKKLLDMMINSIYTHKEIFLRELISNASDATDKLYFRSLTDSTISASRDDLKIRIDIDKDARTLTITDNGIGMTADELEQNLGTIAKSDSLNFKNENAQDEKMNDIEVIGQFGVGFYSAFMVADRVEVVSKALGDDKANKWVSSGAEGYTIEECDKDTAGTVITLYIKEDTENEQYSDYLEQYKIQELVKKYSDYIRYPIVMQMSSQVPDPEKEGEYITEINDEVLNSQVPIWRKNKSELKDEDYNEFYKQKFYDYSDPALVIHTKTEGQATFDALLFVPSNAPMDFYSKDYEKGLQLYSNGVMIMDKCADLLPDYFSFVKGLVDSADLSLNISRELLQHDHQLKIIAKAIDKKIKNELSKLLKKDREKYEAFFNTFGVQLKWGIYADYGMNKDGLKDLILFKSSNGGYTTLKEYVERMAESQDKIYYACGENEQKIALLPQCEAVREKGFEILYFTDDVDEFAIQVLMEYDGKQFANICKDDLDLSSETEKQAIEKKNEDAKELLDKMKATLGEEVTAVKFSNKLGSHAVCLSAEGYVSLEMAKVLSQMPGGNANGVKAQLVLEINSEHPIAEKLSSADEDTLKKYTNILYSSARLIAGLSVDNPTQLADEICELM